MKLSPEKLAEVYERTALEEVAEKYKNEGYEISFDDPLNSSLRVDMTAKKGAEIIFIEAILYHSPLFEGHIYENKIKRLREAIKDIPEAKFRVILITPPENKQIQIDGIEEKLATYFTKNFPDELLNLASKVYLDEVTDVEVQTLETSNEGMRIIGYANMSVNLEYGPSDDQAKIYESFPIEFDILLDASQEVKEVKRLSVDTTTYY